MNENKAQTDRDEITRRTHENVWMFISTSEETYLSTAQTLSGISENSFFKAVWNEFTLWALGMTEGNHTSLLVSSVSGFQRVKAVNAKCCFALQSKSQSWNHGENCWSLKFHFQVLSITLSVVTMVTERAMKPAYFTSAQIEGLDD